MSLDTPRFSTDRQTLIDDAFTKFLLGSYPEIDGMRFARERVEFEESKGKISLDHIGDDQIEDYLLGKVAMTSYILAQERKTRHIKATTLREKRVREEELTGVISGIEYLNLSVEELSGLISALQDKRRTLRKAQEEQSDAFDNAVNP